MATKQNTKSGTKRTATRAPGKHSGRSLLRGGVLTLLLAGAGALSVFGWRWTTSLRCQRIELAGLHYADSTALRELARVDTGMVLFDIDPAIVADRVRRHPWVGEAWTTRFPNGTLRIAVQERVPVMLVLEDGGRPAYFLDRAGYALPLVSGAVYDVPLLRGLRERVHPVQPVQNEPVRELLDAFAALDPEADALVSEFELDASGEVRLRTTPAAGRGSLQVRLGRDGFAEKLRRLRGFWQQAILPQPDKNFHVIDLRFDSQIVTRETEE